MISGTSFDAVEAVLADFEQTGDVLECDLVAHRSVPYPAALRERIAAVLPFSSTHIGEVCELDAAIGQVFGEVARDLADELGGEPVELVCSHGQTVYHWVSGDRALGTLQLGQPAWIAELTGAHVVSDVRNRDIAAGGQGAPLVSMLDALLLGPPPDVIRGALNLGGIANVTVLEHGRAPIAFDIGPSTALMDAAVTWLSQAEESFDEDGRRAGRGKVDQSLLAFLLDEPFYRLPPPKSTGKELFNLDYLKAALAGREVDGDDLLATLTALTAESVARALTDCKVTEIVASGGGTRNPVLMSNLREALVGLAFRPLDEFGVAEASKEALAFALIGYLTGSGLNGSVPSCTGAGRATILGCITPGKLPLRIPTGVREPTGLVVHSAKSLAREH